MKIALRLLILLTLIAAALLCYSMGIQSGFVVLLVLGLLFEGMFWFRVTHVFDRGEQKSPASR